MLSETSAYSNPYTVAAAAPNVRSAFLKNTYVHLVGALLAFVGLESLLLQMPWASALAQKMTASWWLVIVLFIGVSWIADKWALSGASQGMQYLGLGLFVVAEAFVFMPLIMMAVGVAGVGILAQATFFTGILFVGITVVAFTTKKDFSFLGGMLKIAGIAALGLIGASFLFPINLGTWFSLGMVVVAGASILYTTSNMIHHYRPDQHVAAALGLFSGIALMFWYILQLLMNRD